MTNQDKIIAYLENYAKNAQLFLLLEIMPVETWTDLDLTRSKKDGFMLGSQSMERFLCVGGVIVWIMLYTVPKL